MTFEQMPPISGNEAASSSSGGRKHVVQALPATATEAEAPLPTLGQVRGAAYIVSNTPEVARARARATYSMMFRTVGIHMGGSNWHGRFVVPRRIFVHLECEGATIDLTRATFIHPHSSIYLCSIIGRVKIIVPRGILVTDAACNGCAKSSDLAGAEAHPMPVLSVFSANCLGFTHVITDAVVDPVTVVYS